MNTITKRLVCILLCLLLTLPHGLIAFASDKTILCLDKGNIVIGDGTLSGFDSNGNFITVADENGYLITQTEKRAVSKYSVTVSGGTHTIEIDSLNVNITSQFVCAFCIKGTADVTLILTGDNVVSSGASRAGVEIGIDASLTINGDGSLTASSKYEAGIGGGNGNRNGRLVINSGTIIANGGTVNSGAGIGGGSSGTGGTIIINGGNITATGGSTAAGIGGGNGSDSGSITINGGTVTAVGGSNGAGIGGGWYGSASNITINGGTVKAVSSDSYAIGAGISGSTGNIFICGGSVNAANIGTTPTNGSAEVVKTAVNLGEALNNQAVSISGLPQTYGTKDIYTDDSGKIYLYIPSNEQIACMITVGDEVYSANGTAGDSITAVFERISRNILISGTGNSILANGTLQLTASCNNEEIPAEDLTWTSGNEEIATINPDGLVTGIRRGNVKITACDEYGNTAEFFVQVLPTTATVSIISNSGRYDQKVDWWKKYTSAKMSLGYQIYNCSEAARFVWSSSSGRVKIDQNGDITNTGSFSRSATITLTVYDADGNVIANDSVKVSFYKFSWQRNRLQSQSIVSDNLMQQNFSEEELEKSEEEAESTVLEFIMSFASYIFDIFKGYVFAL